MGEEKKQRAFVLCDSLSEWWGVVLADSPEQAAQKLGGEFKKEIDMVEEWHVVWPKALFREPTIEEEEEDEYGYDEGVLIFRHGDLELFLGEGEESVSLRLVETQFLE